MSDELSVAYHDLLEGTYDCVDRVVLNAYDPLCASPGGFRTWWRRLRGGSDADLDTAHLMRQGVVFAKEGNCFTQVAGTAELARVADTLAEPRIIGRLSQLCDRWIYTTCLCFGLDLADQERSGFRYAYSVYQVEYSRNLLFTEGGQMERVFQDLVDRNRARLV